MRDRSIVGGWLVSVARAVGCVFVASALTGCSAPKYTVTVSLSDELANSAEIGTIEIDLVSGSEAATRQLEDTPVDRYFDPAEGLRGRSDKKTFVFTRSNTEAMVVDRSDPIWDTWNGALATDVVAMLNVTWFRADGSGNDPRRLMISLGSEEYASRDFEIEISRERGLRDVSERRPPGRGR